MPLPTAPDATALLAQLRCGELTAEALAQACLQRVALREPQVHAWATLQPDAVLAQARAADRRRALGAPLGPLHGLPVGIKGRDRHGRPAHAAQLAVAPG